MSARSPVNMGGYLMAFIAINFAGIGTMGVLSLQYTEGRLSNLFDQFQLDLKTNDPAISAKCFSIYLPQLQDVTDKLSKDYNGCVSRASQDRAVVVAKYRQEQNYINKKANLVCNEVSECQLLADSAEFFQCFSNLLKNVMGTIYTISNNATDAATLIVQELNDIDNIMYRCTNISQRTYTEDTARLHQELERCLQSDSLIDKPTVDPLNQPIEEPTQIPLATPNAIDYADDDIIMNRNPKPEIEMGYNTIEMFKINLTDKSG